MTGIEIAGCVLAYYIVGILVSLCMRWFFGVLYLTQPGVEWNPAPWVLLWPLAIFFVFLRGGESMSPADIFYREKQTVRKFRIVQNTTGLQVIRTEYDFLYI